MKLLILINLLFVQLLFAQTNVEQSFLSYAGKRLSNNTEVQLKESDIILKLAEQIAYERYIEVKLVTLKTKAGLNYKALQILPGNSSPQNQEATRIHNQMNGLPLIFSPFDLGFGSNAFFDPNGSKLGVPYRFFTDGVKDSSYLHELEHASTYQRVMNNNGTIWAGFMQALKGEALSTKNRSYYFRFAALDEILATAQSVYLDTLTLSKLKRELTPAEFNKSRGEADRTLIEVYFSALAGEALAKQNTDLATRALDGLNSVTITPVSLSLGRSTKSIYSAVFTLDSYEWKMVNGRGSSVPVKDGARLTLYSTQKPTLAQIKKRLEEIIMRSSVAEEAFKDVIKNIYVLIEYPDVSKTNIEALSRYSSKPYVSL